MRIIAFVGMPASGKGEAAEVAREIGAPVVNMGDVIRDEARRLGLEPTDANLGMVGNTLREKEGMGAIAKRLIPRIRDIGRSTVVVDGVRGAAEVIEFKEAFGGDFTLIAVHAQPETRLARVRRRGRSDDMRSAVELRRRDEREIGWGMGAAIRAADEIVMNEGDLEDFREQIKVLLEGLR